MSTVVTLKINDQDVSGRDDETIFEVTREHGINLPHLCHVDSLSDVGACRLCLVEVKGSAKLIPACIATVREGMEVYTHSERLDRYRRMIVEMLFTEGNHVCSVCVVNGHCSLQKLAMDLGIDHINLPNLSPVRVVDASHERFGFDQNRCILCTRCVRVCDEIEGAHTWDVRKRGIESCVITDLDQPWGDSDTCTSCGKCVQVCPTGALFVKGKAVGEMVKHKSFLTALTLMRESNR